VAVVKKTGCALEFISKYNNQKTKWLKFWLKLLIIIIISHILYSFNTAIWKLTNDYIYYIKIYGYSSCTFCYNK
jgi:hypothetical protein